MNSNQCQTNESCDLAVIGGGVSGLGIAEEAALRGYRVILLEKGLCCRATSENSLRIIHGGLRYLQTLDLFRTVHSLTSQAELLREAPDLVRPLACLMPLNRSGFKSRLPITGALAFYTLLARIFAPDLGERGRVVSAEYAEEQAPLLKGLVPYGALLWRDAVVTSIADFCAYLKGRLASSGVEVRELTEVLDVERQGADYKVRCRQAGGVCELSARMVVNASGPWLRAGQNKLDLRLAKAPRGWSKAFNIILNRQIESRYAVGISGDEGRLYFTVPRDDLSVVGTFYVPALNGPDQSAVKEEELQTALAGFQKAWPAANVSLKDVKSVESGILPVKRQHAFNPVVYGTEKIFIYDGYVEVLSTKFTTFRNQARRVLNKIEPRLRSS